MWDLNQDAKLLIMAFSFSLKQFWKQRPPCGCNIRKLVTWKWSSGSIQCYVDRCGFRNAGCIINPTEYVSLSGWIA